ncbi:uncharacterized protein LOC143567303 [Bidens hawaiensis]|uniref:uncharacterized protein LOC143567303 n=1 Tax=Bidens hawaiensis TaxID=980011 RepID=UPI00404A1581
MVGWSNSNDSWRWLGDHSRVYSVKSVRKKLMEDRVGVGCNVVRWSRWAPIKCNIFAWRAVLNRLPTSEMLIKRNINVESTLCLLCGSGEDTIDHILSGCLVSSLVWQQISVWCRIPQIFAFSSKDIMEIHSSMDLGKREKEILHGIIIIGSWRIWKARNLKLFEEIEVKIEDIMRDIKALGFLWLKNRSKIGDLVWDNWCRNALM